MGLIEEGQPGEVLGPWRDCKNTVFQNLHGEEYISINFFSNVQILNKDFDLPRNHPNHDPLFKVRPMIDMMDRTFLQAYKCGRDLSFDEGCCPYKGRVYFCCYNPSKPNKWHLKLFEVSDARTGYVVGFDVYTGKNKTRCALNAIVMDPDSTQTTKVVVLRL